MFRHGAGFLSSSILWPLTNGWEAASHSQTMNIEAGADGQDRSTGLFAIMRTNVIHATQKIDYVRVPGSGPVKITHAPLGRMAAVSAQHHGTFRFTSKVGITGTLYVSDDADTVTLDP